MRENDFECFASTGVKTPDTMFPNAVESIRTTAIALKPEISGQLVSGEQLRMFLTQSHDEFAE